MNNSGFKSELVNWGMHDIPLYSIPDQRINLHGFKLYSVKSRIGGNEEYPGFPNKTNVPHRHDFFEICIFIKGEGTHEIDFNKYEIKDRSIHFVAPGQVHLISHHEDSQGFILAFTESFIELNRKLTALNIRELPLPYVNLQTEEFKTIEKLLDNIMSEYSAPNEESEEVIKSFLYILMLKIKGMFRERDTQGDTLQSKRDATFSAFKVLVEKDYISNQQVSYFADQLNISPSHLNKISKSVCGKTASDFIHDRVMLEAKRLLVFSDMSSKEIAYHLQYEDPSYFSRIFKKKTGFSPSGFKKSKLEKYQNQTN